MSKQVAALYFQADKLEVAGFIREARETRAKARAMEQAQ